MIFQISILFPPEPAILNSLDLIPPGPQDSSQIMKVVGFEIPGRLKMFINPGDWHPGLGVDPINSDVETANVVRRKVFDGIGMASGHPWMS